MTFTAGDRVGVEGLGGRYQRQSITAAVITSVDAYRGTYAVRYYHLFKRAFTTTRVPAARVMAVEEMPFALGDGAWEEIEADLDQRR